MSALIIGFGNPDCGDDAIGPLVARRLAGRLAARVIERHGDALGLIEEWTGTTLLILVDAAAPLGHPGRLHRIDLAVDDLPQEFSHGSTHAYGLPEAVALSRRLGSLPERALAYAIEGTCFTLGASLSPPVAAAVESVCQRLIREVAVADPRSLSRIRAPSTPGTN